MSSEKSNMTSIGNFIREARKSLGLTQKDLAKLLNVSRQTIISYESDLHTPTPFHKNKLKEVLNIDLELAATVHKRLNIGEIMQSNDSECKERRFVLCPDKKGKLRAFDRDNGTVWEEVPGSDTWIKVGQIPTD